MNNACRYPLTLIAVVWLCGVAVARGGEAPNLAQNPSFEAVNGETGLPEKWTVLMRRVKGPPVQCEFQSTAYAQDGNTAAMIVADEQEPSRELAEFYQLIPVTPGTRYFFSVYMLTSSFIRGQAAAVVEERTKTKGYPAYGISSAHAARAAEKTTAGRYCLYEVAFTAGPDTYFANLSLRYASPQTGTVMFDRILFVALPQQ